MLINLPEALESWATVQIRNLGYAPTNHRPLDQLMILSLRILEAKPRLVCTSRELDATLQTLPQNYREAYLLFRSCVERGTDLRSFMSKSIVDGEYLDGFLFDWGFYHFHLNTTPDSDDPRFINRSDYLLIARVENEVMCFIQIFPHRDHMIWYHEELMRIFADNWPDLAEKYRIKFVDGLSEAGDENQRKYLREVAHANVPVDLGDGRVYWGANMGISRGGTPVKTAIDADRMHWNAVYMQQFIDLYEKSIVSTIQKKIDVVDEEVELKLLRPEKNDYVFQLKDYPVIVRLILHDEILSIVVGDSEEQIEEHLRKRETEEQSK